MSDLKLLYAEDNEVDRAGLQVSIQRFSKQNNVEIQLETAVDLDKALEALDNSFDGCIVDMNLDGDPQAGNQVLNRIRDGNIRIPIAILTGTPDAVGDKTANIQVYKKGEAEHDEILNRFQSIHNSGITRVMGGRGKVEELLNRVYHENILSQENAWISYGASNVEKTEKSLLRHTLNHLIHIVDLDEELCFPEEFYITPPMDKLLRTGCVCLRKEDKAPFVVLTPLCDLTVRANGKSKANNIIVAGLDTDDDVIARKEKLKGQELNAKSKCDLRLKLKKNNAGENFHYLPKTDAFAGGNLNFELITSVPKIEFNDLYDDPMHQISPSFLKDIVSRFSSYLGRQGQPEIGSE